MEGRIHSLRHYPIKGLSAQPLDQVDLQTGQGFPWDRIYGFARPGSGFDPDSPRPLPKSKFVMLARDGELAMLNTHFDPDSTSLTITRDGQEHRFGLLSADDRDAAAQLLCTHLGYDDDQRPTLYSAHPHRFTDVSVVSPAMMNAVSLINLDSVTDLADKIGKPVDPARFRGNILFSGIPAFCELDWVGRTLTIGEVTLQVVQRTRRCPATQVDPATGVRDMDPPELLKTHYGHSDMGIYAEVRRGGLIRPGDTLQID